MPNWCNNTLTLTHDDPAMITKSAEALKNGKFFETFIPIPEALKETTAPAKEGAESVEYNGRQYTDWYMFCVNEWGTKWDVESYGDAEVSENGRVLQTSFDSAWSPPIEGFRKLDELGFTVEALYYEPGMGFCGAYSTIDGEDTYEIPSTSDEVDAEVPSYINEAFGIADNMREWEQEQIEDEDFEPLAEASAE